MGGIAPCFAGKKELERWNRWVTNIPRCPVWSIADAEGMLKEKRRMVIRLAKRLGYNFDQKQNIKGALSGSINSDATCMIGSALKAFRFSNARHDSDAVYYEYVSLIRLIALAPRAASGRDSAAAEAQLEPNNLKVCIDFECVREETARQLLSAPGEIIEKLERYAVETSAMATDLMAAICFDITGRHAQLRARKVIIAAEHEQGKVGALKCLVMCAITNICITLQSWRMSIMGTSYANSDAIESCRMFTSEMLGSPWKTNKRSDNMGDELLMKNQCRAEEAKKARESDTQQGKSSSATQVQQPKSQQNARDDREQRDARRGEVAHNEKAKTHKKTGIKAADQQQSARPRQPQQKNPGGRKSFSRAAQGASRGHGKQHLLSQLDTVGGECPLPPSKVQGAVNAQVNETERRGTPVAEHLTAVG